MKKNLYRHYVITAPDGQQYVGVTTDSLRSRFTGHKKAAECGQSGLLYDAIRSSNADDFVIDELHVGLMTHDEALELEVTFMKRLNTTLNRTHRKQRHSRRLQFEKKLLLRINESMLARIDALGLETRSDAIRRCVLLGLEQLEQEMQLKPSTSTGES